VGPVQITGMTPAAASGQHGWMVNPGDPGAQAFDNRAGDYDGSLMPTLPYTAQPGESVIKTKSLPEPGHKNVCVQFAAVLTVVAEAPQDPAVIFRPPYAGTDKSVFTTADLRADLLPSLEPVTGAMSQAEAERRFRYTRLDFLNSYHAEETMPFDAVEKGYGGDMTQIDMQVYLWLCLNSPVEDKMNTLIYLVQAGIDLYGCHMMGTSWFRGGGGIGQGRCLIYTFAATMLESPEMKQALDQAGESDFLETNQLYYGSNAQQVLFGIPNTYGEQWYWDCIAGNCSSRDLRDPEGWIDGGEQPASSYQGVTWGGYKYTGLVLHLIPHLMQYWPEVNRLIYDYAFRIGNHGAWTLPDPLDRFPDLHGTSPTGGGDRTSPFGEAMWDAYNDYEVDVYDRKESFRQSASFDITIKGSPFTNNSEEVVIEYIIPVSQNIQLNIRDAAGSMVKHFAPQKRGPGRHQLFWNGTAAHGLRVNNGVYYLSLQTDTEYAVKKLIVLR
jgi:hypothetical protein